MMYQIDLITSDNVIIAITAASITSGILGGLLTWLVSRAVR